jgi:hypothetical protein
MIKELLKKDGVILTGLFIGGIIAHFSLYVDWGFEQLWIWPNDRIYWNAFAVHYIFGTALGLLLTLRDEVTCTQEFLWHRPVSRQLVFGTRMLAGFGIMIAWLVLALVAEWIVEGWGNPNKLVADGSRAWTYLAYGTITFSSFAAACFAASWPAHWVLRFTLGAMPALFILLVLFGQSFVSRSQDHPAVITLVDLVATALLLYAAWRNEVAGPDPDHPVHASALRWSVPVAALAGCLLGLAGLAELQGEFASAARRWYPEITPRPDGSYYLRGLDPDHWPYQRAVVDDEHRVVGSASPLHRDLPRPWWPRPVPWPTRLQHPPRAGLVPLGRNSFYRRCYLARDEGLAHEITIAPNRRSDVEPSRRVLGKGPQNRPFSPEARVLGDFWRPSAMLWDQDGIWVYDPKGDTDHFQRVALPQDDQAVDWTTVSNENADDLGLDENRLLVRGEKGTYGWTGSRFEKVDPFLSGSHWRRPAVKATVDEMDPFTFTAVVAGPDGKTVFRHRYALYTWHEKLPATVVYLASLLRLPVLQVQSFLRSAGQFEFRRAELTDPLLAGHKRFWLLGLNLLVAGTLAMLAVRRLRRLGAPRGRVLSWAMAIAVGGLPLFLYYRFTETNRAWRKAPILKPEEIPSMWIRSA